MTSDETHRRPIPPPTSDGRSDSTLPQIDLSIIAPAHNEESNIAGLLGDVELAFSGHGIHFEMILIDDGSTDETASAMAGALTRYPWLRCYRMARTPTGQGNGQSAALYAGIRLAAGETIALMDADRQNDPSDLPPMLKALSDGSADMVQGDRSANREDSWVRRASSRIGRSVRHRLLADPIRDTGCSLRVFRREVGLALPLQYEGIHRFIPIYARILGYRVLEVPVVHRPRIAGKSKYGAWNRALPGLIDLFAVRWMRSRLRDTPIHPIEKID
jgi:glycosyltransferase involved in cell wall biosynthesis